MSRDSKLPAIEPSDTPKGRVHFAPEVLDGHPDSSQDASRLEKGRQILIIEGDRQHLVIEKDRQLLIIEEVGGF